MARTRTWTARAVAFEHGPHPAGRPHRQQAEPDHAMGEHARRGRRGHRPPGRHRAGDRAAGPIRRLAAGCTSSSSPAAPARLARRPTICSASGTRPRNRARVSRSFAVIRNRWRLSLTRWSSSKYRSAVIAWSPEDRPTDAQIEAVLDEFDKTAWAGLDADRYSWTVVLHREQGGGSHAHVLTARCDPETGRSLNIAPPGREKALDRCATSRARLEPAGRLGAGEGAATRPSRLHRGRDTADRPEARNRPAGVDPGLPDAARRYGAVRNRADAVAALEDAGLEVPRKGKSYVTVRNHCCFNCLTLRSAGSSPTCGTTPCQGREADSRSFSS